ncbi:alpha/beta hydrolase [Nocardiopsis tropica]|uniref:Alpha/beta hydrolase n=1 Tax=Nocardiopsis tropica TaxID=109330 RepID=A0ABU7KXM0_9ACTN|nr:alpha/beta hydrolase [Nocardiopsis umidischolae]MEE2054033.1 alpha/beta hydrolase [Nocardiopsis umidischolae]
MTAQTPVTLNGRAFSYLDFGGDGVPLVALHGTFGRAASFTGLAPYLAPDFRVIALDQRGHGLSEHGGDLGRDAFVGDAAAFLEHLGAGPAIVLGHSLGGVTAYQLAARRPELVRALVVEDIGAVTDSSEVENPVFDTTGWPTAFPSREALAEFLTREGVPALGYFMESAHEHDGVWRLRFDHRDMLAAQRGNTGDFWADWLGSACPALLLRGGLSPLLSARQAGGMAERRPGTRLRVLPGCGHWVHRDDPSGYALAVRDFLGTVPAA